jgi:hypothetical protein
MPHPFSGCMIKPGMKNNKCVNTKVDFKFLKFLCIKYTYDSTIVVAVKRIFLKRGTMAYPCKKF